MTALSPTVRPKPAQQSGILKVPDLLRFLPNRNNWYVLTIGLLLVSMVGPDVRARTIISTPFGTTYQVNVDRAEQNIAGDAANEPSLCIDPTNPNRIAVGWRQFNSTNSNFRQAGYGFSTNGGTWVASAR